MKTELPVKFSDDPDQNARLFFTFSSVNNDDHMQNLSEVVELLSDEENMQVLLSAKSVDDLRGLP